MNDKPTILEEIFGAKRIRVEASKAGSASRRFGAKSERDGKTGAVRFVEALSGMVRINVIAEVKRASPSKGIISPGINVEELVSAYESGGASAISVLTEQDYFHGSIEDLKAARNATNLPILRKDFIFDEFQVFESAEIGADAILLIASMLNDKEIDSLSNIAETTGLGVLLEVHDETELERALNLRCDVIGVNNRNLNTFDVRLETSRRLAKATEDRIMISESGLNNRTDILELSALGYSGFLIGESFMRAVDPASMLREFIGGHNG